jgi:hypothetical protein
MFELAKTIHALDCTATVGYGKVHTQYFYTFLRHCRPIQYDKLIFSLAE